MIRDVDANRELERFLVGRACSFFCSLFRNFTLGSSWNAIEDHNEASCIVHQLELWMLATGRRV